MLAAAAMLRGDEPASINLWAFTPGLFPELRRRFGAFLAGADDLERSEFLLPEVIQALVREGRARVDVLEAAGPWCGLTFREDEARARQVIAKLVDEGRYPRRLWP